VDSGHSGQVDKLKINMELNQKMYLSEHFSLAEMTVTHGPMSKQAVALNFFSKKALILK
jgi:hypothetical protein